MLSQLASLDPEWSIVAFRYFNVAGVHESGLLRPALMTPSRNMVAQIAEVAAGELPYLDVFESQHSASDGTLIRDYVHVMDIADAHLKVIDYLQHHHGFMPINIGSGHATSTQLLIEVSENTIGKSIPVRMQPVQGGDVSASVAGTARAETLLGWKTRRSLEDICRSEWLNACSRINQ